MSSKLLTNKNYIDNIFTFLNVDLKNNEFLNLINLNGPKTIYTPTETTPFFVSIVRKFIKNKIVVVLENNEIARKVFQDCQSFLGKKSSIIFIPEIETHPMSGLEKNSISFTERNDALSKIIELNEMPALIITSALSLAQKIPEKNYFYSYGLLNLKVGQIFKTTEFIDELIKYGYKRSHTVENMGEFSVRGSLIDVFPIGKEFPYRIDFYEENIEGIRIFEPSNQRTIGRQNDLKIRAIDYEFIDNNLKGNILDLMGKNTSLILSNSKSVEAIIKKYNERFFLNKDSTFAYNWEELKIIIETFRNIFYFENLKIDNRLPDKFYEVQKLDSPKIIISPTDPIKSSISNIEKLQKKFMLSISSTTNERLKSEINSKENIIFNNDNVNFSFSIKIFDNKLLFIGDKELFGYNYRKRKSVNKTQNLLKSKIFEINSYVVHEDHGVAKFKGITKLLNHYDKEYLELEFAEKDKLFVPAEQISKIEIYKGGESNEPKLHRLHGKEWEKQKNKVKKSTEILASELLFTHSNRVKSKGFKFKKNNDWQITLEKSFPYKETEDQETSIKEIYSDMEKNAPMDRLLCGDVGFGKTELAIRASFKAVQSGKQVAILVPTTILAEQHFETFKSRLNQFPVNIGCLSRLRDKKEIIKTKESLKLGNLDICIGTHKMLQDNLKFKDLGLFIIDEEHKFGVKQKEILKKFRINVDILSLSATPIPRTMNLALSGIKDLSSLEVPPFDRRAVKTYVIEEDEKLFREIILREKDRNGQVFIVFNRVKKIEKIENYFKNLVPEVNCEFAHGRMEPKKLSKVIKNFSNKEIDVLISTTIIESGLDMPDANTVIIMNPQQMGLAQLYQLRGRVGRSETQAFAYLVVPKDASLNTETKKRLDAMTRYQYLGAGKEIALRDMEIRGVGNILGKEQSGNVNSIGLNLFMKFLKNAVNEKRNFKETEEVELPVVEIDENIGIPENFIPDIETRLQIYNEISQINETKKLESLKENYEDRFGELPPPFLNLFSYQEIKILALKIGIKNINLNERNCLIKFNYEIFGLTNLIEPLIKLDSKFVNNNIRIYGDLNIQELNYILTKILDLKSNLIPN